MSAQIASPSSLPELPPEIWLKIFQIATFIPFERDLPATTFESGLFCSYDTYQISAFERVLPLRLSIVLVSRRFYQIGAEVLYTAFHANARLNDCDPKLSLFSDLLVSRPELGRFIRRLSLWWSDRDEENNYRIISRCPNVIIFSSFAPLLSDDVPSVPWWRGLPKPSAVSMLTSVASRLRTSGGYSEHCPISRCFTYGTYREIQLLIRRSAYQPSES